MNKSLKTPIGEFTAQIDPVLGEKIEAYLGIPYAKSEAFGLPEIVDTYPEKPANTGRMPSSIWEWFLQQFSAAKTVHASTSRMLTLPMQSWHATMSRPKRSF